MHPEPLERPSPTPALPPVGATSALMGMVVIWALNFSVAKDALRDVPPLAFNALRFPFAAAVVYVALRSRGPLVLPHRRDVGKILAFGILGNVVYQYFFIYGLAHSRAGTASLLLAGTPMMTALLSRAFGQERPPRRVWLGALATFLGIGVVVYSGVGASDARAQDTALGSVLLLCATLCWASYTVGSRPIVQRYGSMSATAWMLWTGTVGVLLMGLPDLLALDLTGLTAATWLAVIYAGALSIGLAYLFWHYGVKSIGNTRTSVFSNLVPALALLIAWITLGEVPTPGQIAGAAVIIGGVTLAQLR